MAVVVKVALPKGGQSRKNAERMAAAAI